MAKKIMALLCVALIMTLGLNVGVMAETAEETNILLGKTVTFNEDFGWVGDAESNSLHPDKLVDGDESTMTAVVNTLSQATLGGDNQIWFKVDLGAIYDLSKVELVCRGAEKGWSDWDMDYTAIMVSSTDVPVSQMTEVARTKGYWDNGGELTAGGVWSKDLSVSARYIAIYADNRTSGKLFACAEWRAYGVRNNNLMAGLEPTEVTGNFDIIPQFTPSLATDGNLSTICYSSSKSSPSFKYDLGGVYNIERVELYSRNGGGAGEAADIEIYGSQYDLPIESMKLITTTPSDMGINQVHSYILPEVRAYRYIALKCTDERIASTSANSEFIIAEFKVFDTEKEAVPELIEPFETNVAVNKPLEYNESLTYLGANYMPDKLNDGKLDADGAQNFIYMLNGNTSTNIYYIIDLENAYFINRVQVVPRNTCDSPDAMKDYKIVGSLDKVPASEMEVIATIDAGNTEWNFELETPKKYRYIGIYKENNGRMCEMSEFRAFSYAEAEYSAWSVKEAGTETEVSNIEAGVSYDISMNVKNNYIDGAPNYIILVGGYDKDGFMTTIKCFTVEMPPAPLSSTLKAENVYMPEGTVKMSCVLLESINNALMVTDSCDLFIAE